MSRPATRRSSPTTRLDPRQRHRHRRERRLGQHHRQQHLRQRHRRAGQQRRHGDGARTATTSTAATDGDDNGTDLQSWPRPARSTIGRHGNDFAGDTFFIDNQTTQSFNLTATTRQHLRRERQLPHRRQDAPPGRYGPGRDHGLITWVAGNVYVTDAGTRPQHPARHRRGRAGDTVNVEAGSYVGGADAASGGKDLTLSAGASPARRRSTATSR